MRRFRLNGFTLLEVLIASVIVGLVAAALTSLGKVLTKQSAQSTTTFQMSLAARNYATQVNNPDAWKATLNYPANSALACLKANTDCSGKGGDIVLLGADGTPLNGYDPIAAPTAGFRNSGTVCTGFDDTKGNDDCPFRLVTKWEPVCPPAGPCINPVARVTGEWKYRPIATARTLAFNAANYNFTVSRGGGAGASNWVSSGCAPIWSFIAKGVVATADDQSCCTSSGNRMPSKVCQDAGFSAATGGCRGIATGAAFPGPVTYEGTLMSNDGGGAGGAGPMGPGVYFACTWGGFGMGMVRLSAPVEILCQ